MSLNVIDANNHRRHSRHGLGHHELSLIIVSSSGVCSRALGLAPHIPAVPIIWTKIWTVDHLWSTHTLVNQQSCSVHCCCCSSPSSQWSSQPAAYFKLSLLQAVPPAACGDSHCELPTSCYPHHQTPPQIHITRTD